MQLALGKFQLTFLTVDKIFTYKNPPYYQKISFKERKQKEKHLQLWLMLWCALLLLQRVQPIKKPLQRWQKVKEKLNNMQFNNKRAVAVIIRLKKKKAETMKKYDCQMKQLLQSCHLGKKKICLKITHTHYRTCKWKPRGKSRIFPELSNTCLSFKTWWNLPQLSNGSWKHTILCSLVSHKEVTQTKDLLSKYMTFS